MDDIFDQIMGTLDSGFPYAAIVLSLAVPDICANLRIPAVGPKPGGQKSRYLAWYRENLANHFPQITEEDFYSLRNGVVHSGTFGSSKQYARIVFGTRDKFAAMQVSGLLCYEARWFCETIIKAGRYWYEAVKDDSIVRANIQRLVRPHPDGLRPYAHGIPMIG